MIYEAVITTTDSRGRCHITPMGYRETSAGILIAPFVPSQTLSNLRETRQASLSMIDDVAVIAGCLTGRRDWPTLACEQIGGWRLAAPLAHQELVVEQVEDHPQRPQFLCRVVFAATHAPFKGYNRAQAAVIEAAILVSRLDWLSAEKVKMELDYLSIAIEKTAGERELLAWRWLLEAIHEHPRHAGLQVRS